MTFLFFGLVVGFGLGVYLGQDLKDWVRGVPAATRAELQKLEAAALAKMKAAAGGK